MREKLLLQALQRSTQIAMKWYADAYEGTANYDPKRDFEQDEEWVPVFMAFAAYGISFEQVMDENFEI